MSVTKKEIAIAIIFLSIGIAISYFYNQNRLKMYKSAGYKVMNNCIQTVQAADSLAKNCGEAYKIVESCVSNLNSCDLESESKKLDSLNKQKSEIEDKISKLTEESGTLIEVVDKTISQ